MATDAASQVALRDWLLDPVTQITDPQERRYCRLLASILLLLPVCGLFAFTFPYIVGRYQDIWHSSSGRFWLLSTVICFILFQINRRGHFRIAVSIMLCALYALVFLVAVPPQTVSSVRMLLYLPIPTLIGSLFLSLWATSLFAGFSLILTALVPLAFPAITFPQIANLLGFNFIFNALVVLATFFRNRLEHARQIELAAQESWYKGLMETVFGGIAICTHGCVSDANTGFARLFGYPLEELKGVPVGLLVDAEQVCHPDGAMPFSAEGRHRLEAMGRRRDGTTFPIEIVVRMQPFHGETAMAIAVRDTSEELYAQNLLQQRSDQLALLYEAGQLLSRTLDLDMLYNTLYDLLSRVMDCYALYVSSYDPVTQLIRCAYARQSNNTLDVTLFPPIPLEPEGFGTQSEAIRSGRSILVPDYLERLKRTQVNYHIGDDGSIYEEMPDENVERTRSALVVPILLEGQVTGVIQALSLRVNAYSDDHLYLLEALSQQLAVAEANARLYAQVRAELAERRRIERALRESEGRFRLLYEQAPLSYQALDNAGRFLDVNRAWLTTLGYQREEIIGHPFWELLVESEAERFHQDLKRVLREGELHQTEYTLLRHDGAIVKVSFDAAIGRDDQGQFTQIHGILTDVTARRRIEEELLKTHKLESLGILAGGIAHDFNNLLTGILGNISLAQEIAPTEPQLIEVLANAERATMRSQDLTRQLLTFAKGGVPVKKVGSLADVLQETASFILSGSRSRCAVTVKDTLWNVEMDAGQISQVFNNLILNAAQSMPTGGVVEVSAENISLLPEDGILLPAGDYVRVSIKDQGVGIEREHLARIFDPYFSTKPKGSGLGLTSAYSIVRKHHGLIDVESEVGVGTTFRVYLPASHTPISLPQTDLPITAAGAGRVLIMDDDELVSEVASRILRRLGYEATIAREGETALALYAAALQAGRPFAALVMDLTIPGGMGGKEAVEKLLEIDPNVRAIVSSGYANDPIMASHREYGFRGVVTKPYHMHELGAVLAAVLAEPNDFPATNSTDLPHTKDL